MANKTDVKTNIDLNGGELRNPVVHPVLSFPESPSYGQACTVGGDLFVYTSLGWLKCTIQIATDAQATAGTAENVSVNPKQLSVKANKNYVDSALGSKQNSLTSDQMKAVNSGIDSEQLAIFNGHVDNSGIHVSNDERTYWNNKQPTLTEQQQLAVNSGVTTSVVEQVATNKTNIGSLTSAVSINSQNIEELDDGKMDKTSRFASSVSMTIDPDTYIIHLQLKDQNGDDLGGEQLVDIPLESVVVDGEYDSVNKKIVLTLENGNTIDVPVGDLVAGLQTEITAQNKLSEDFVDDTSTTNKFGTSEEKTLWNNALQPSALNGYATETWVGQQGFLTSTALAGYATQQWVTNQGYLTSSALN